MRPRSWFVRHRRLALVAMLLMLTLTFDLLLTSTVRAVGWSPFVGADHQFRIAHARYHHGLRARVECGARWGSQTYSMRTNSLGLRDAEVREVDPVGRPGARRLLLLGDSFTEGIGVDWDATFAGRLADSLAERSGIEVLNAGCVSYSPILYRAKLRHLVESEGLRIDHVLVLIDASDVHDEACHYEAQPDGSPKGTSDSGARAAWRRFYREHSLIAGAIAGVVRWMKHNQAPSKDDWSRSLGRPRAMWAFDDASYREFGELGTARAREHMLALLEFARAHGIEVAVAVYPWPDHVARGSGGRYVEMWRNFCAAHELPFFDLCRGFFAVESESRDARELFIPGDVHFAPAGHELMFRQLAAPLAEWIGR